MAEDTRDLKQEQLDKLRCARFILEMIMKYGAQVKEKREKQHTGDK